MGEIRGDVDVLGISNILQMLSMNGARGFLTIYQEGQKKVIHFLDQGMRLVSGARRTNPLGEILIRTGKITREQLDEILAEQRRTGAQLGEIVCGRKILDESVITSALREQVAEEIYDLFTWSDAKFAFTASTEGPPTGSAGPLSSVILDTNMMSLMIEAARRVDELANIQSIIPDVRLVAERLELPASLDDPSLDRNAIEDILPLVDGQRSVGHIIEESLFPKFTVLRTLYGLAQRGVIKIRDRGDGAVGPHTVIKRPATPASERGAGKGRTVLLLSDLPTFRAALSLCLRSEGYDVVEDGIPKPDAGDTSVWRRVDVAVLDVPIESDDSLKLCAKLKDRTKAPFIVLSGNASKPAIAHAMQSGARYVLVKPVNEDLLAERIANVLKA
jgi:CheY-like chemotaxis protein